MSHRIIETCIGCGACQRNCPVNAITGDTKELHVINPKTCIDCGTCGRVCPKTSVLDAFGNSVPRVKKADWIRPVISESRCYACENCVGVCPTGALSMKDENLPLTENFAVLSAPELCVSCGWCLENCQFGAITMEVGHGSN